MSFAKIESLFSVFELIQNHLYQDMQPNKDDNRDEDWLTLFYAVKRGEELSEPFSISYNDFCEMQTHAVELHRNRQISSDCLHRILSVFFLQTRWTQAEELHPYLYTHVLSECPVPEYTSLFKIHQTHFLSDHLRNLYHPTEHTFIFSIFS